MSRGLHQFGRCRWILAAIVVLTTACGGGDGEGAAGESPTSTTTTQASSAEAASADDAPDATTSAGPTTTEEEEEAEPEPVAPEVVHPPLDGLPSFEITAVATESPSRPLLTWTAVDGAAFYSVTVYDGDQRAYWATLTDETETFVGGPVLLLEDKPGPRAPSGGSWHVSAVDEAGRLIAWSAQITFVS